MVDILLSIRPNYFTQVEEGIWYRETFSIRKSFCLDVDIDVTKIKNHYLVIRNDRFVFHNGDLDEYTYAYILKSNRSGSLAEFKIYVDSRDKEVIKNTAIDQINLLDRIIVRRSQCSKFSNIIFPGTPLFRQSDPTMIVLNA